MGFSRIEITPALGDPWWLTRVERILDPVYARVIYLEQDGGERFVLAMADHGGFDRVADQRARTAISQATGVPVSHVRINASHNHSCPEASWTVAGLLDGIGQRHASRDWMATCEQRLAQAAGAAQAQARPARAFAGTAEVPDVSANLTRELARRIADPVLQALPKLEEISATPLRLRHWTEHVELHPRVLGADELARRLMPAAKHQWITASMLNVVQDRLTRELDLFVLRAGDCCLAGLPAESMVESAIALRAASPVPHTMVGAYFDCSLWYIPTYERLRRPDFESNGDWDYTAPGTSEQITAAPMPRPVFSAAPAAIRRGQAAPARSAASCSKASR